MRIKQATIEDIPRIMECAREFCSVLPDVNLNEAHYSKVWEMAFKANAAGMFLLEDEEGRVVGGIGGLKAPAPLSGELVAVELFWYVKPEHRKGLWPVRLLKEYERWAKEVGCRYISMIYMEASMPDRIRQFYQKSGYELLETVYRKSLKP